MREYHVHPKTLRYLLGTRNPLVRNVNNEMVGGIMTMNTHNFD